MSIQKVCDDNQPQLTAIMPDRKQALRDNQRFLDCLSDTDDDSNGGMKAEKVMDGVFYIDSVLSPSEASKICSAIDGNCMLSFWNRSGRQNEENRMFRDADTIEVDSRKLVDRIWFRLNSSLTSLLEVSILDQDDVNWERELCGRWMPSALNHDLLFAKYPSHGSFAPHTDGRAIHDFNTRSFYSVILFLNTIPPGCGGGTRFYQPEAVTSLVKATAGDKEYWSSNPDLVTAEVHAVAGRMLIFHQSLVHEGVPPLTPFCKYIMRSDIMSQRTPAICDTEVDREAYQLFRKAEDLAEEGKVDESLPLFKRALKMSPTMARIMGQG